MYKSLRKILAVFAIVSSFGAVTASAAMMGALKLELLGGINDTLNNGGGLGYTGGADLAFWLGPVADLTVGAQYLSRAITGSSNVNYVQIPAVLHLHLGPMISFGGGGFYDVPVTGGALSNYGLTGAVRIKPALIPIFVEGRYNYGMNTTNFTSNSSEVQALLGIIF